MKVEIFLFSLLLPPINVIAHYRLLGWHMVLNDFWKLSPAHSFLSILPKRCQGVHHIQKAMRENAPQYNKSIRYIQHTQKTKHPKINQGYIYTIWEPMIQNVLALTHSPTHSMDLPCITTKTSPYPWTVRNLNLESPQSLPRVPSFLPSATSPIHLHSVSSPSCTSFEI